MEAVAGGFAPASSSSLWQPPRPLATSSSTTPEQQQQSSTAAGPSRTLKTRTRTGCMTCRKRKHKCGEEHPSCERCLRAGFDCVWPTADQMPKGRAPRSRRKVPAANAGKTPSATPAGLHSASQQQQQQQSASSFDDLDDYGQWDLLADADASVQSVGSSAAAPAWTPGVFVLDGTSPQSASPASTSTIAAQISPGYMSRNSFVPWQSTAYGNGWDAAGPGDQLHQAAAVDSDAAWIDQLLSSISLPEAMQGFPTFDDPLHAFFGANGHALADHRGLRPSSPQAGGHPAWATPTIRMPLCSTPTPMLELLFKDPTERSLVQHFLFQISAIFVGRAPSARGTRAIPAELLARGEQLDMRLLMPYFDFGDFLARPRGSSLAVDALATAIMSLSASHLAHLHHLSNVHGREIGADAKVTEASALRAEQYCNASGSMARTSLSLVRSALNLAKLDAGSSGGNTDDGAKVDEMTRLLSACSFAPLIDCVSNGNDYKQSLTLAKDIVTHSGGARRMLETVAAAIPASPAAPQAAACRRRLRLLRSALEEIASWEMVTSLTTGQAPTHFVSTPAIGSDNGSNDPQHQGELLQDWLHSFAPPSGSCDSDSSDWETLEASWGASRLLMDLFARVNTLCAAALARPTSLGASQATMKAASTLLVEINIRKTDVLHRYPELSQTSFPPLPPPLSTAANEAEANEEVRLFVQRVRFGKLGAPKSGSAAGFVNQRRARRIDLGDLLWCLMLELVLRIDVLGESSTAADLQTLAGRILDLVIESHARRFVPIGLAWPMIIAGSIMPHPAGREQARRALATFEPFMLFELERVAELWDEVWADRDEGGQATWRDVAARNGGFALE